MYQPSKQNQLSNLRKIRGNSLLVSMVIMLAFSIMVLGASRYLLSEQKISANQNDRQFAFQLAELALKNAEVAISTLDTNMNIGSKDPNNDLFGNGKIFSPNCATSVAGAWSAGLCESADRIGNGAAVAWLRSASNVPILNPCGNSSEFVYEANAGKCSYGAVTSGQKIWANPRYIVELINPNETRNATNTGRLYRVTARAWGRNQNTQVTLQSFFFVSSVQSGPFDTP